MFSERRMERLAGVLLVASFIVFLGHLGTLFALGADLAILLVLMYGFLGSLSGAALYMTFRPHGQALALFGAFGFVAHGLFIVLAAALLLAGLQLPQELAAAPGGGTESVAGAVAALELAMDKIRASAFLFLGVGMAALGVLIVWSGALARWMGWLGVVSGTVGFFVLLVGLSNVVLGRAASILTLLVVLTPFTFTLILGVTLFLRGTRGGAAGIRPEAAA